MGDVALRMTAVQGRPGIAVIAPVGPLDARNVAGLEAAMVPCRAKGIRAWVLDLGEVKYVNSLGMAYLVNLSDELKAERGALVLANPQPKVKVLFELMGLAAIFTLHRSVSTAVRSIRTPRASLQNARPEG
jgi:anti-sigma B factor antagonist